MKTYRMLGGLALIGYAPMGCSSGGDVLVGYNRDTAGMGGSSSVSASLGGGAPSSTASNAASGGATSASSSSAGSSSAPLGSCDNGGPNIVLPNTYGCTTDLAKRVFPFAVCTCADFVATNRVLTDSFDSRATTGFSAGASIGCNGDFQASDLPSQIGGSLWVLGATEYGGYDIAGEMQCKSSVTVIAESRVHRDATVMGNVDAPSLTVDGAVRVKQGASCDVQSAGKGITYAADINVNTPCECGSPVDISVITKHFAANNDNATASLLTSALTESDEDFEKTLPCGRFYLDSIGGAGMVTLHLTGKTLIAIGGRVSNSGGLTFDLGPSAELDLFVDGDFELSGAVTLGRVDRPSATRVYVSGQVALSNRTTFYANWYIPNYPLAMSAPSEFWGAVFAKSVHTSGGLAVHYDQAILELPSCNESGGGCGSCHDCANPTPACRNGKCEACQVDSDCCPPLFCNQGQCQIAPPML